MNDNGCHPKPGKPGNRTERKARIFDGNPGRRTASGPADIGSAPKGRTYDRSQPNRPKRQKSACHQRPSTYDWIVALLARKPARLVTVALANKLARIVCAMMKTGEGFRAETFAKA